MKTVKIVYLDGEPSGVRKAWITSELNIALDTPRNKVKSVKKHSIAQKPAVYFLAGEKAGQKTAYIGETGRGLPRILHHKQSKGWWQRCILMTSQASTEFDRSSARYLEAKAIREAKRSHRYTLSQSNTPRIPTLSEHKKSDLDLFYNNMKMLLGVLNQPILSKITREKEEFFYCSVNNVKACGQYTDEGMVVVKGSTVRKGTTQSCGEFVKRIRQELINKKVLSDNGKCYVFDTDYIFSSPSTASSVCLGRQTNGWTEWKNDDNKNLDDVYR